MECNKNNIITQIIQDLSFSPAVLHKVLEQENILAWEALWSSKTWNGYRPKRKSHFLKCCFLQGLFKINGLQQENLQKGHAFHIYII